MGKNKIIESIKNRYPSIDINSIFLKNINLVITDFSEDEIINIHKYISFDNRWFLYMTLYSYNMPPLISDMIKYIVKNSPILINNIYTVNGDIINEKLFDSYEYLMQNNKNIKENELEDLTFNTNFINYVIEVKKKYNSHQLSNQEMDDYLKNLKIFFINLFLDNQDNIDERIINSVSKCILNGTFSISKLYNYCNYNKSIDDIVGYVKFSLEGVSNINCTVLDAVKKSYVDNILKIIDDSNFYKNTKISRDDLVCAIIKMISTINYQNTEKLIREYCDSFEIRSILYSFLKIDLSKYQVNNRSIEYKNSFINFMMGKNLNDKNSLINRIINYDTELSDKLSWLFNYWEEIEKRYSNQSLYTKTAFIERLLSIKRILLNPDEYQLEGDIINSYIDNKKHQSLSIDNIIDELRKIYHGMKHNYYKTIPYVNGKYENYSYETIKADDPVLFSLGAKTDNCFKIGGQASSFVKYCALNKNGRVVVIRNKKNDIVAMIPMIRNGNLVLCNSIESYYLNDVQFMKKMFEILKIVSDKFILESEKKEDNNSKIKAILIGNYKNRIDEITTLKKETELSYELLTENEVDGMFVSSNLGGFDYSNYIVATSGDYKASEISSFIPNAKYLDPRDNTVELEIELINEDIISLLNDIKYEACGEKLDLTNAYRVIFNKDWFIVINRNFEIETYITSSNPIAFDEYRDYLLMVNEFILNGKNEDFKVL